MLQTIKKKTTRRTGGRFAIVASEYNGLFVNALLREAKRVIGQAGGDLEVVRVPGAFEIPAVVAALAQREEPPEAILCLGVIIQGETEHARLIAEGVTQALAQVQVSYRLPVIHEVLLVKNAEQARVRCLSKDHNRGAEAAQTAIHMQRVMRRLAKT